MRILITGISGFIGCSLSEYLCGFSGTEIIGISRKKDFISQGVTASYTWDDLDEIGNVDCIIHLAGLTEDKVEAKSEKEYFHVNTGLTKRIYDFFLTSSANTFIFFSTIKAAIEVSGIPIVESGSAKPTSIYGKSKQKAEDYILNHLPNDDHHIYILRPCMIHGPKHKGSLFALCNYIRMGFPYPFAKLSNKRSYLSIGNLHFILTKLIESTQNNPPEPTFTIPDSRFTSHVPRLTSYIPSGIYHLADDDPLSTTHVVDLIGETLGKNPRMVNLPAWFVQFLSRLGTLFHLPFNQVTLQKLTGSLLVSNEKIKKALSISNLPVSSEEGMKKTLISYSKKKTDL